MSTYKKRKIKIKKKNFLILILIMLGISYCLVKGITWANNILLKYENNHKNNETKKKEEKEENSISNMKERIDYYNEEYEKRYQEYQKKNKNLSIEQIIKDVNMNLDQDPYENTKEAKNLNTEKILVNKYYYLSKDYVPKNLEEIDNKYALEGMKLVKSAKEAFEKMAKDAAKQDLTIVAMSTYRSYNYQVNLYNRYVKEDGKEEADTYSGRPGHSEHQTGYAVDVYNKEENYTNFEKTKEYKWMSAHAHEYGFILRFPKDKEKETGYHFESWHYRYVGIDIARYIKNNNISFEEYYATKIKDW